MKMSVGLWLARAMLGSIALFGSPAASPGGTLDLPFTLTMPAGKGPFPAVVILHDCSGLGPKSSGGPWRWSTQLTAKGYVTIWPDSFSTRGHPDGVCTDASPPVVSFPQRADDAYAALAHLQTLPNVDARRVAVMGGSHGGSSTLATIVDAAANSRRNAPRFAAAIALYPGCGRTIGDWSVERVRDARHKIAGYSGTFKPLAPLLILTGELDDWTPAEPCRRLAAAARQAGHPVEIVVYPGAHHSFDSRAPVRFVAERRNQNSPTGLGATTGGNAQAWADAITRVEGFLGKHLAATNPR
jgi:dienelactone hydrolase